MSSNSLPVKFPENGNMNNPGDVHRDKNRDEFAPRSEEKPATADADILFSPIPPVKKHPRFYVDSRTIELQLDDSTLYRVFRQPFETHSTGFTTTYLDGHADDERIQLPGVASKDLDRFLSLMYPSELATCDLSTADEWLSVLRLAHKWSFPALRTRAIREIHLAGSAVNKIAAAREFADIEELQGWLLPAFKEACSAPRWLRLASLQDAERLGAGTILAIARIREEARAAEEGTYDVDQALVVAGLAPGPAAEKVCSTSQADVLRSMFSGRPAGLAGATIDESSSSATAKEPPTLVATAPAYSPRMPHHEDVSWPPPKAPWGAQSTRRGARRLVAESVSSTSATVSHMTMVKEHVDETAPPVSMPDAAPPPTGSEAQPYPTPGAGSPPAPALASSPAPCSATAMSTDRVAPPPIVDDQVPCATSLPNPAPSSSAPPSEATAYDALSRNALLALGTAAPSAPINAQPAAPKSLNGAPSSAEGSATPPTTPATSGETKLCKTSLKKLRQQKARREQELRKQEDERKVEAARTVSATSVTESADGAKTEEQAGYSAL